MKSTKTKRIWKSGPPPHIGWWNASNAQMPDVWRWWNGKQWSRMTKASWTDASAAECASIREPSLGTILWTDYWPKGARVPRRKP